MCESPRATNSDGLRRRVGPYGHRGRYTSGGRYRVPGAASHLAVSARGFTNVLKTTVDKLTASTTAAGSYADIILRETDHMTVLAEDLTLDDVSNPHGICPAFGVIDVRLGGRKRAAEFGLGGHHHAVRRQGHHLDRRRLRLRLGCPPDPWHGELFVRATRGAWGVPPRYGGRGYLRHAAHRYGRTQLDEAGTRRTWRRFG